VALLESGRTLNAVSKELGVSVPTLISWKKRNAKVRQVAADSLAPERGGRRLDAIEEVRRLRAELAQVIEERDRLRRSLAVLIGLRPGR
jgi:transposase-like protein